MQTKNAILVRRILRRGFPFSQKIKRKEKCEKEGRDIHIFRISTTFVCQQVNFLIFSNIITQSTIVVKTKIEVFTKNIDSRASGIAILQNNLVTELLLS